jgi:hypothetical protein
MKRIVLLISFLILGLPVFAAQEEVLPPINANRGFSGVQNTVPKRVPELSKSVYDYNEDVAPVKEAKEIKKNVSPQDQQAQKRVPMTYGNFPQNYDSSNVMMMMEQFGRLPGQY